jgi:glycyl-tRNA synthetase
MSELWGLAHRGQHDLTSHIKTSGKELYYLEPDGTKIIPEVIEPSVGLDRLFYALICEKYEIEKVDFNDEREVLRLPFSLSPYQCAFLPLSSKLNEKAFELYKRILDSGLFSCIYDQSGSIGKRYRRQDAIGTFYCITYDFESEEKNTVTIRERDSMKQVIIFIDEIESFLTKKRNSYLN